MSILHERSTINVKRIALLLALAAANAHAAEVIPPKPAGYFNDYAGVVSKAAAERFNAQLEQFERETSNQVVVAIFPKMESSSDIADYAQRIAQSWGIGSKAQRNGVALLVFTQDRKISIQVGYGLEGALPDATAYDIRANHITPHFRNGDYEGGLAEGIDLICKAIRGEYKGDGVTVRERQANRNGRGGGGFVFLIFFVIVMISIFRARKRGYRYSGSRGPYVSWWPDGGGGSGWSSGSGGGGFSGGGGSFGGGGSSGGW